MQGKPLTKSEKKKAETFVGTLDTIARTNSREHCRRQRRTMSIVLNRSLDSMESWSSVTTAIWCMPPTAEYAYLNCQQQQQQINIPPSPPSVGDKEITEIAFGDPNK